MNDALEILYRQWYDNIESSDEAKELYQLFCNTGDKSNDDMSFEVILKLHLQKVKWLFMQDFILLYHFLWVTKTKS